MQDRSVHKPPSMSDGRFSLEVNLSHHAFHIGYPYLAHVVTLLYSGKIDCRSDHCLPESKSSDDLLKL
jgi:hypothetical protein